MLDATLDEAIVTAEHAAERASQYKSETYLAVLLTRLLGSVTKGPIVQSNRANVAATPLSSVKPYSAAELFATKVWETEIEKVLLAGYFLENYSKLSSYTIAQIRDLLVIAKVALPKNVNLAVLQAVQKGWMME